MPFRRRSSFGRSRFRKARTFVRKVVRQMGPIEAKRIILEAITIPDITTVPYDNPIAIDLIVCQETVDEEIETNGTNVAQVPLYSKIVGMKLNLFIRGAVDEPLTLRWMLYKMPDGETLITSLIDANFHSSDDNATQRELRGLTLAKGILLTNVSSGTNRLSVFVRRKTLQRLGALRENDRWRFILAANGSATIQATISGMGTIYTRMN